MSLLLMFRPSTGTPVITRNLVLSLGPLQRKWRAGRLETP